MLDITYIQIIDTSIPFNENYKEEVLFLRNFFNYLKTVKYRNKSLNDASIKIYINRLLNKFVNEGYLWDLLGGLKEKIRDYSPGGSDYDEKDHNNTLSALKHLWMYYWKDRLFDYIYISYSSGYQSFGTDHNDHVTFSLENKYILNPRKQKMDDYDYYAIRELIADNVKYLSPDSSALNTIHGPISYYSYVIGKSKYDMEALRATRCHGLFSSDDEDKKDYIEYLNKSFVNIVNKYC